MLLERRDTVVKLMQARADVQQKVEKILFDKMCAELQDDSLKPNQSLVLDSETGVEIVPDFFSEATHVIGEIYAHMGKLRGSQGDKIAADILKMLLYEKKSGIQCRKYFVICSEEVEKQLLGKSALAESIKAFGVCVKRFPLDKDVTEELLRAQQRQDISIRQNPSGDRK